MRSGLVLPRLISDGMVLQRRKTIHIWGWDEAGAEVEARLDNHTSKGVTNEKGRFDIYLPARESGGPYELTVSDNIGNSAVVRDVMVGVVWFCTGQSNMELPINRVKDRYPALSQIEENPGIRTFKITEDTDFGGPLEELRSGSWSRVSRDTIMDFSATGYFFAAYLQKITDQTVGFINASLGGSRISSWMSSEMLEGYDELLAEAQKYADDDYRRLQADKNVIDGSLWRESLDRQDRGLSENWKEPALDDGNWKQIDIPFMFADSALGDMCGAVWFRRSFDLPPELAGKSARLFLGTMVDRDEVYVNGVKVGGIEYQYPPRKYDIPEGLTKASGNSIVIRLCVEYGLGRITPDKDYCIFNDEGKVRLDGTWKYKVGARCAEIPPTDFINWHPTGLYNAMTAPCHNYPIDGILWYQGESNTHEPWDYEDLSRRMIKGYRDKWGEENLPYILVQLPNFVIDVAGVDDPWPTFRLTQSRLLDDPMVGMTVNMDLGEDNDLHPTGKRRIGKRLALWAAHLRYGYPSEYCGPIVSSAKVLEDGEVELIFDHAEGLVARDIGKGDTLCDFKVVDTDGKEHDATAKIMSENKDAAGKSKEFAGRNSEGRIILKTSLPAGKIKKVRYLVDYTYHGAMIYNRANLPMGPFEIETGK